MMYPDHEGFFSMQKVTKRLITSRSFWWVKLFCGGTSDLGFRLFNQYCS